MSKINQCLDFLYVKIIVPFVVLALLFWMGLEFLTVLMEG